MIRFFSVKSIKLFVVLIIVGLLLPICIIPLRLIFTTHQVPKPQAILVLGSDSRRVLRAANIAQVEPNLHIWISDFPFMYPKHERLLLKEGIAPQRVRYDFCATDTVTNFTCTVKEFSQQNIRHVYLVTSDFHMKRARIIAALVFGSRGIAVTPISVAAVGAPPESFVRVLRDSIRSLVWMITGRTGAILNHRRHNSIS
jgi:uncharacterized SAM-binding protein YcdF (DUF218 family)